MAHGLAVEVPATARSPRAWRRSWLLGYSTAVIARGRAAEQRAATEARRQHDGTGPGAELVLAHRSDVIRRQCELAYPQTRKTKITYTGSGYGAGYTEGQHADIGSARLRGRDQRSLGTGGR